MAASIITSVKGDVTYDGIPDTVSLIGVQFGDSNAWQQMSLVIQNGATGQITAIALPEDAAFLGELSLSGALRPVTGVLPMALTAARLGIRQLFVPAHNAAEATLADGLTVRAEAGRIEKPTFGSTALGELVRSRFAAGEIDRVELVGLCTDICVISNALLCKAFCPELPVSVDAACCAGVTPENHRNALSAMQCCQIDVLNIAPDAK